MPNVAPQPSIPLVAAIGDPSESAMVKLESRFVSQAVAVADAERVETPEGHEWATAILAEIKQRRDELEDLRTRFVKPLNDHVKRINAFFRGIDGPIEQADKALRGRVLKYRARGEEERRRAEAERERLAAEAVRTALGSSTVRRVWDFEVVDLSKVPGDFLMVDVPAVRNAIRSGIREIPGLRIFQREDLAVKSGGTE